MEKLTTFYFYLSEDSGIKTGQLPLQKNSTSYLLQLQRLLHYFRHSCKFNNLSITVQDVTAKNAKIWKAFVRFVQVGEFFCSNPYQFDPLTQKLIFTKSKKQMRTYLFLTLFLLIDNCYLAVALHYKKHVDIIDFIQDYAHWISRSSSCFINIVQLTHIPIFANVLNSMMNVKLPSTKNLESSSSSSYIYRSLSVLTLVVIFQPLGPTNAFIHDSPTVRYWHSIILAKNPWIYFVIFGAMEYWISFHALYCWVLMGIGLIVSTSEIKKLLSALSTATETGKLKYSNLLQYRTLQTLNERCNECFTKYVWTFGQLSCLLAHCLCNCATILLFRNGQIHFLGTMVGSVGITWALNLIYYNAASMSEVSKTFRCRHSIGTGIRTNSQVNLIMRSYGKSCGIIAVHVGSFYKIQKTTILVYLHMVVNYTVTYLLLDI